MLKVTGQCTCGEEFDGASLTEAELRKIGMVNSDMAEALRETEPTPIGVVGQVWWLEHMKRVPDKARVMHDLTIRVEP